MTLRIDAAPALEPALEDASRQLNARIDTLFAAQQAHRWTMAGTTAAERIALLRRLKAAIVAQRQPLYDAMYADFHKHPTEVELTEIQPTLQEIGHAIKHLKRWMKPRKVRTPALLAGTRSAVRYEPKGVVLILAPWNYPFGLLLNPLVAAVAAGNCAIVRPSEKVPHTARVLAAIIAAAFQPHEVALVGGAVDAADYLLTLPFDHIFFTGSIAVGRKVAAAAGRALIPVTLELGGKSPVIVDQSADLAASAERIVWGKFINAGQTCVAPDYVLVHAAQAPALLAALTTALARLYGDAAAQRANPDLCRIIDDRAFARLVALLDASVAAGARLVTGGERDAGTRYLAPTILADVTGAMPVMEDEIFGPILPVLTYTTLDEALSFVNARPKPLALYIFSRDRGATDTMLARTTAGGTAVNNVVLHLAHPELPFGGVGTSGHGSYHGSYGFRTFSHERAVLVQGRWNAARLLYPPYGRRVRALARLLGRVVP